MLEGALTIEPARGERETRSDDALSVEAGEPVRFLFTVTNTGDGSVTLRFRDACKADFVVSTTDDDTEQWRWSNEQLFAQVLEETTIGPTEQETFEAGWKAASGRYTVQAKLLATDHSCEAESLLSVN